MSLIAGLKKNFIKLSSFQILVRFRRGLFYSFLSIYLRFYLNLSVTETTLFATLPMIVNILFQNFIWGALSDKLQKRRTFIILGEILAAIGTVLTWYVHTLEPDKYMAGYVIIIGLTIIEIFWSMSNLGWTAILSDLYEPKKLADIRGKLASVGGVGRIIGVLIGGLAYDGLGQYYRGWGFSEGLLFFIAAGMMLLSCIPVFYLPEGGISQDDKRKWNKKQSQSPTDSISKLFWLFITAMVFINFGRNSIATIKAQFFSLEDGLNLNPQMLSYIVNMRSIAMIIFGAITGILLKKLKEEWLLFFSSVVG
ncbi:MAG: MFS transporter, partial [Candidatus Cloacimonetes bacterium]|nr:MFS transporter [Candidatus Cloacimonadota bacterium]